MGLFDHFPYTNVHELNLDWVLSMMKALEAEWEAFTAGNSLTFADPMLHDVTKTYAKNTIVLDGTGNAYVSLQAVPVGVGLQNGDYWLMVFDYEAFIEKVNKNFTVRYYRGSYRATSAMAIGDWLTVDDVLYKATAAIAADDVLEDGVNITHFTLEDFIKAFMQSANQLIQQYKNDIDASELAYRNQLALDIANTTASLQAQLDAAISGATVDSEVINARVGANNVTYPTLGDAIRTQLSNTQKSIGSINSNGKINLFNMPNSIDQNAFDVSDDSGNIILSMDKLGFIHSHDFDSFKTAYQGELYTLDDYSLAVMDESNNIVFGIKNGKALFNNKLYGKKVSIIGDSISTYYGFMPAGYPTYYPNGNVNNSGLTWWRQVINHFGLELLTNASWSGSKVTGDSLGTAVCACSDDRISDLKGSNNEDPDIILIYISTNDWVWGEKLGSFTSHDDIPSDGVIDNIADAYALMLYKIRTTYPDAVVYCITNLEGRPAVGDNVFPYENSKGDTIHDVNHAISEIAHIFGCEVIDLETCGINFWNIANYTTDGHTHPNAAGMKIISDTIIDKITSTYNNIV